MTTAAEGVKESGEPRADIFVSYASEDRARILPLVHALKRQGWTVWWDRSMLAGERVDKAIEAVLRGAKCVFVVWTRASVAKEWVVSEADDARKRGVLIPVLFDDVEPPLAFRMVHTADLVNWSGDTSAPDFDHLAKAVARLTGSRPDPPPDVDPKLGTLKK